MILPAKTQAKIVLLNWFPGAPMIAAELLVLNHSECTLEKVIKTTTDVHFLVPGQGCERCSVVWQADVNPDTC